MSTVLIFLIVLVVLVVIHELGHFFVAKAFGVRVDEFGVGYPPRARKLFTWKGTLFTLNWLPFGGFVKIFGEQTIEHDEAEAKKSFAYQTMGKRVLIIVAGILANTMLAVILYSLSFGIGFLGSPSDFPDSISAGNAETIITNVLPQSPASSAGIKSGDVISALSSGGQRIIPTTVEDVTGFIQNHAAGPITITIKHGGSTHDINVTPKIGVTGDAPAIGIAFAEVAPIRLPFWKAIATGAVYTFSEFKTIIHSLGLLVTGGTSGGKSLISQVSGPVGIAEIAGQAYSLGIGSFLSFVALISVNLAVINLLPFPALDGGRIVIELFTSRGRSRIPARVISAINQIGFLILILFMLYVTYHDIAHLML